MKVEADIGTNKLTEIGASVPRLLTVGECALEREQIQNMPNKSSGWLFASCVKAVPTFSGLEPRQAIEAGEGVVC